MRAARLAGYLFFLVAFAWASFVLMRPEARASDDSVCDPYPNINVNINPVFDEPLINTSHSLGAIQGLARSPAKVISMHDAATLGLTHYEPIIEFRVPMLKRLLGDGTTCVKIHEIDATIGYRNVTIYIANEIARDTCAMHHVLEHEKKHVAINRSILMNYVPYIQKKLMEYMQINGLYRGPDPDYAESLMTEKARFVLNEAAKQIMEENSKRQRTIDTPEEYARNNTVCGGRINALVSKAATSQR